MRDFTLPLKKKKEKKKQKQKRNKVKKYFKGILKSKVSYDQNYHLLYVQIIYTTKAFVKKNKIYASVDKNYLV